MRAAGDIMERIYTAADTLFEQNGRAAFPTVDAVRKVARVNMNDANSGMREWRRSQMARAAQASVQIPAAISQAQAAWLAEVWQVAQTVAGEALTVAQAVWDTERGQLEALNREMADAFEGQSAEVKAAHAGMLDAVRQADNAKASCAILLEDIEGLRDRLAATESNLRRDAACRAEVERRSAELRCELDHAHAELAAARADYREVLHAHAEELSAVRADALRTESLLREELEASRQQQRELMQIVFADAPAAMPGDDCCNAKDGP